LSLRHLGARQIGLLVGAGQRVFGLRQALRSPAVERAKAMGTYKARLVGMTGADAGASAPVAGETF